MRCYLMRKGHIASVEIMPDETSDEDAIKFAQEQFERRREVDHLEAFEVWRKSEFVYRWPAEI